MKLKVIIGCILVAVMLVATPALALSLGVSPTHVELEVTGDGTTTVSVNIHYFSGDVDISLVNIPLRVEPSTIHVDASGEPVAIELTIYGNHSLDTQVYDGYIRFIAVSGGAATGGVQIIAKVTNVADGIPAPSPQAPVVQEPATQEPEPVVEEPAPEVAPTPPVAEEASPQAPPPAPVQPSTEVPLVPILIGVGSVVALILLIMVGVAIRRRT